MELKMLILSS